MLNYSITRNKNYISSSYYKQKLIKLVLEQLWIKMEISPQTGRLATNLLLIILLGQVIHFLTASQSISDNQKRTKVSKIIHLAKILTQILMALTKTKLKNLTLTKLTSRYNKIILIYRLTLTKNSNNNNLN